MTTKAGSTNAAADLSGGPRPRLGVSACVLGHPVRFNAGAKRFHWLTDVLKDHADFIPVCPEVEMGLGTPREAVRLARPTKGGPLVLRGSRSGDEHTANAEATIQRLLASLPEDLDGFVLQNLSPLCGVEKVKIYDHNGSPSPSGTGLFAAALALARPGLAIIEAGRLHDAAQRESFLLRLFTLARFRTTAHGVAPLQAFHREHKFLLLAHGKAHLEVLGRAAADGDREAYRAALHVTLKVEPTRGRVADALVHMYGFLKQSLAPEEKTALLSRIDAYRAGALPLVVPLALLSFANTREDSVYLRSQRLFSPFPPALSL